MPEYMPKEIADQLIETLTQHGLIPPSEIITDGVIRCIPTTHRPNKKKGSLAVYSHNDGTYGAWFSNWHLGIAKQSWHSGSPPKTINYAELEAIRQRVQAERELRNALQMKVYEENRLRAVDLWQKAKDADYHPYLTRKNIAANGAKLIHGRVLLPKKDGIGKNAFYNVLIIPMRDSQMTLRDIQLITPEGDKVFQAGGRLKGLYQSIGRIKDRSKPILIAESFSTSATIHEATQLPVANVFSWAGLEEVGKQLRRKFPTTPLVYCADDDWLVKTPAGQPNNVGVMKAEQAAVKTGGSVIVPKFGNDRGEGDTDFNDVAKLYGQTAVSKQFADFFETQAEQAPKKKFNSGGFRP